MTTAFLVLVIWGSAVDSRAPSGFAGVAIGIVVAADIMVTGPIAGASMNTARSFGPFLAETILGGKNADGAAIADWAKFPIYIIGPIVGWPSRGVRLRLHLGDQEQGGRVSDLGGVSARP